MRGHFVGLLRFGLTVLCSLGVNAKEVQKEDQKRFMQNEAKLFEQIEKIAKEQITQAGVPNAVIGVLTAKSDKIIGLGKKNDGSVPSEKDIYPISSISKMVTGLIAARGVAKSDFKATTKIKELLGADLSNLVGDRSIELLVSHRAGYRSMPKNLNYKDSPHSPGTNYDRKKIKECLERQECSIESANLGTFSYSNIGLGLMGLALGDFYKKSYEQVLAEKFTQPLGLVDTQLSSNITEKSRIVSGLTKEGVAVGPAQMGVLAGAGEIVSSGKDMMKLLKTLVYPDAEWKETIQLATTPIVPGAEVGYAIDIKQLNPKVKIFSKGGVQDGYTSFILWAPNLNAGVFLLTNKGKVNRELKELARKILKEIAMNVR